MSRHATAAISAIDRALGEVTPCSTHPPSIWCWRCQTARGTEAGMMCQPCRDYMCGDSDLDPKTARTTDAAAVERLWPLPRPAAHL